MKDKKNEVSNLKKEITLEPQNIKVRRVLLSNMIKLNTGELSGMICPRQLSWFKNPGGLTPSPVFYTLTNKQDTKEDLNIVTTRHTKDVIVIAFSPNRVWPRLS